MKLPRRAAAFPAVGLGFALAVVTLAVFAPLAGSGFVVYDDEQYVVENPMVRGGLTAEGVRWALTTGYAAMWSPLSWISHMIDVEIHGLEPGGHHATSVILHVAATLLLFAALRRLTGSAGRSAIVAGLFAVHPLHVQSVAWVAERKDVLSACFAFLSLWLYARYAERPTALRYAAVFLALAAGLMAKPMLVTLPFVLLLIDVWPLGRLRIAGGATGGPEAPEAGPRRILLEKLPLFALSAASSVVTAMVQREGQALTSFAVLPLAARAANAVVSYARYLAKTVWPTDLAVFYPYPPHAPVPTLLASAALLAAITALALKQARRRPYLLVGWLWFVGMLVPVIGLVQTGSHAMADRFTYLPLVGLFLAAVWAAGDLAAARRVPRAVAFAAAALLLLSLAVAARREVRHWHDSVTLFSRALETTRDNPETRFNLGTALQREGRLEEARGQLLAGLRMSPRDPRLRNSLGAIYRDAGRPEDALREFRLAIEADPRHAGARMNLGIALFLSGRKREAVDQFREASRIEPGSADAHFKLGFALAEMGRPAEAEAPLRRAVEIRPDWAEAWNQLGASLASQGRVPEAIPCFVEAVRLDPKLDAAARNLERARRSVRPGSPQRE